MIELEMQDVEKEIKKINSEARKRISDKVKIGREDLKNTKQQKLM